LAKPYPSAAIAKPVFASNARVIKLSLNFIFSSP
jgi:hypothetical protein